MISAGLGARLTLWTRDLCSSTRVGRVVRDFSAYRILQVQVFTYPPRASGSRLQATDVTDRVTSATVLLRNNMAQMELPPTDLEDSAAVGASPRAAEGAADSGTGRQGNGTPRGMRAAEVLGALLGLGCELRLRVRVMDEDRRRGRGRGRGRGRVQVRGTPGYE